MWSITHVRLECQNITNNSLTMSILSIGQCDGAATYSVIDITSMIIYIKARNVNTNGR